MSGSLRKLTFIIIGGKGTPSVERPPEVRILNKLDLCLWKPFEIVLQSRYDFLSSQRRKARLRVSGHKAGKPNPLLPW